MDYPMVISQPEYAIQHAQARKAIVVEMRRTVLRQDVDFGVIPGTSKPTLLKPGAERLCAAMGFNPVFEVLDKIVDFERGLFYFQYACRLYDITSGHQIASGNGSCNSMEAKYRFRNAERICPHCGKSTIIKGKAEYGGGWLCFAKKGGCGAKFADDDKSITEQEVGKIENDDPFSIVNTIDKMAQKRALIAAVLIGANASEFFTQDIEDMPGFGFVESEAQVLSGFRDGDKVTVSLTSLDVTTDGRGQKVLLFATDNPQIPTVRAYSRKLFQDAKWCDENEWLSGKHQFTNYPILVQAEYHAEKNYWIVSVIKSVPDDAADDAQDRMYATGAGGR